MSTSLARSKKPRKPVASPTFVQPDFAAIVAQAKLDGLWVLPACADPAKKHPCIPWKRFQIRRPTRAEMADLIRRYPRRNGCYVIGPKQGRIVFDLDGLEAFRWAGKRGLPVTQTAQTSRGWHFHFRHPGFRVKSSASKIHQGVDIKGDAGIAVAVGSVHKSGRYYKWMDGYSPSDVPLSDPPEWLISWLRAQNDKQGSTNPRASIAIAGRFNGTVNAWARTIIDAELAQLAAAEPGTRNNALAHVAFKLGQLVGGGEADFKPMRDALYAIADQWENSAKSYNTINRCLEAGARQPRRRPDAPSQGKR